MSDPRQVSLWPPSFSTAIFDFDGTLADTWSLWRQVDEIFFSSRGLPFDEDASTTLATLGFAAGAQWCVERYRLRDEVADIVDEWNRLGAALYESEVRLRPGAEAYVRALRSRGVRVGLATTNDPHVLGAMRHVDVGGLFDEVVCGREVARGKDHPDIYLEAARRMGADPADCVVFEDILPGTLSAARAGMTTVAVASSDPRQPASELRRAADRWIVGWEGLLG
ncbi:HAD family phosphatase [Olsenella sp. DSM 107455]|uniref:HAD family phosphatase n=1 Tax=Thermophilibacter gallinarum TaxID=2779357 RepID=A0ABR9QTK1_9ACTN|nr:HAD family phosphatase [Thermophilibacter gallinarum]MBE5024062.1 HAD family phosphatase [Thermophilibacter gallinarum]